MVRIHILSEGGIRIIKLYNLNIVPIYLSVNICILIISIISKSKLIYIIFLNVLLLIGYWLYLLYYENISGVITKINRSYNWFIISEIMIFATLFFSYFYTMYTGSIELSLIWPPKGINTINKLTIPLLNTILLINSGILLTIANYKFNQYKIEESINLTIIFLLLQYVEYSTSSFIFSDSVYSNYFYILTSMHFIHVLISVIFTYVYYINYIYNSYTDLNYPTLYAHIVDIIWIFLFIFIY